MAFMMRPAYRRHLSLSDQNQIRFGGSSRLVKDEDGKITVVKTMDKPKVKKTLKERLKEKKIESEDSKKEKKIDSVESKRDTKSVKKTASSKHGASKSASKTRETLKKSAKTSTKKEKKDEFDQVFTTDKMSDLIDDSKEYKSKKISVSSAPKTILPLRKESNIKGYRNQIASGIVDFNDKRKGGCFMRNASYAFDVLG
jgi:hypothetical protein